MTEIELPRSKSIYARAAVAAAYCGGDLPHAGGNDCDDIRCLHDALSAWHEGEDTLNLASSGTALRLMLPLVCSTTDRRITLCGTEQLCTRPVGGLVDALRPLGGKIEYAGREGFAPLTIYPGSTEGTEICVDASVSSQFVSALMLMAPVISDGFVINLTKGIVSQPYIEMTAGVLRYFGVSCMITDSRISVSGRYTPPRVSPAMERDWSAAAPFYQYVAIRKSPQPLLLKDLRLNSLQGDSELVDIFRPLGVLTGSCDEGIMIRWRDERLPLLYERDMNRTPDLVPSLAFTLCSLSIPFRLTGIAHLRKKESDRLATVAEELGKSGYKVTAGDSYLKWNGELIPLSATSHNAHGDHRIAMAIAAMGIPQSDIGGADCVSKSFPGFFNELKKL